MRRIEFSAGHAMAIEQYASAGASAVPLLHGTGESHVYCLHIEPGGIIGTHTTGFHQILLVVQGSGWACGDDGVRVQLRSGQGVAFEPGEVHSKGSEAGMMALMIQASGLSSQGAK